MKKLSNQLSRRRRMADGIERRGRKENGISKGDIIYHSPPKAILYQHTGS